MSTAEAQVRVVVIGVGNQLRGDDGAGLDVSADALPSTLARASNHTIGIGDALELARTLGRLPARVVVYGIEGASFGAGADVSPEVAAAIDSLADTVLREARLLLRSPPPGSR